jgi:hypothetical protein
MRRWNDALHYPSAESRCEFGIGADDCVSSLSEARLPTT